MIHFHLTCRALSFSEENYESPFGSMKTTLGTQNEAGPGKLPRFQD